MKSFSYTNFSFLPDTCHLPSAAGKAMKGIAEACLSAGLKEEGKYPVACYGTWVKGLL